MHGRSFPWLLAAALLATGACRPTRAEPPSKAPEPTTPTADTTANASRPKLEGDAVVRVGAKLYLASTGEDGFDVPSLGISPGLAVHIVGDEENGRVPVETVAASEHHCAAVLGTLAEFRLRLYVSPADFVTVLTEDVEHAFDDGTKVLLSRGVPSAVAGEFVAHGTFVRVPVPASRIGIAFASGQPRALDGEQTWLASKEAHPLEYDGRALAEESLHHDLGSLVHYGATERGDGALVIVRNPCLEVTASVALARLQTPVRNKSGLYAMKGPKNAIPRMGGGPDGGGILGQDGVYREGDASTIPGLLVLEQYELKADAPIWSADGRPAGKVVTARRIRAQARVEGDRTCFDVPLDRGNFHNVSMCFAPADVAKPPRTGYGNVGGGTGPRVRQAKADVKGTFDRDVIRRIVRAYITEVQRCYEQGLAKDPALKGRIAIAFTINADGSVSTADVAETSLADAEVGACIGATVKRLKFPKPPDGGTVQVTYPFVLEPG